MERNDSEHHDTERHYRGQPFPAIDGHGGEYSLTPAYHAEDGSGVRHRRTYAAADCVGLVTGDGRSVTRIEKGRYLITDPDPERQVPLFSDDPHAP